MIRFDTDIEDVADAQFRYLMYTRFGVNARRNQALGSAIAAFALFAVTVLIQAGDDRGHPAVVSLAVIGGLLVSAVVWYWGWTTYESRVKRRLLVLLKEELGPEGFVCQIELTAQGVVIRQKQLVITYAWPDFLAANELPAGVELRFRGGYVIARARAFETEADRASFVRRVHALAPPAATP